MLLLDPSRVAIERERLRESPLSPPFDAEPARCGWYADQRPAARRFIEHGLDSGRYQSIDAPLHAIRRVLAALDADGRTWPAFDDEAFAAAEDLDVVEIATAFIRHLTAEGGIDAFVAAAVLRRLGRRIRQRRLARLMRRAS